MTDQQGAAVCLRYANLTSDYIFVVDQITNLISATFKANIFPLFNLKWMVIQFTTFKLLSGLLRRLSEEKLC